MTEADLMRAIQIECTKLGARVFRNNVGKAWVGKVLKVLGDKTTLINARYFHAGLGKGSSDLIGWTRDGRFLAIEVKTPRGRIRKEQVTFIDEATKAGCIAFIARSIEDVREKLG